MNEWINIGLEYPKLNENVLLTDGEKIGCGYLCKIKKYKYFMSHNYLGMITHWMPLPDIPK